MLKAKNKKAAVEFSMTKLLKIILMVAAVAAMIYGVYKLDIPSKLNIIFPTFGKENVSAGGGSNVGGGSSGSVTFENIKRDLIITDSLKQALIFSIERGFEIHVELNPSDKSHPIIFTKKTTSAGVLLLSIWDYNKQNWIYIDKTPSLSQEVIIRNFSDLEKVFGIKQTTSSSKQ